MINAYPFPSITVDGVLLFLAGQAARLLNHSQRGFSFPEHLDNAMILAKCLSGSPREGQDATNGAQVVKLVRASPVSATIQNFKTETSNSLDLFGLGANINSLDLGPAWRKEIAMQTYVTSIPKYSATVAEVMSYIIPIKGRATLLGHSSKYEGYILQFEADDHEEALDLIWQLDRIVERTLEKRFKSRHRSKTK